MAASEHIWAQYGRDENGDIRLGNIFGVARKEYLWVTCLYPILCFIVAVITIKSLFIIPIMFTVFGIVRAFMAYKVYKTTKDWWDSIGSY